MDMAKRKITPQARHPDRTQKFLTDVEIAIDIFEDEISSLSEEMRSGAYKTFLEAYRDALVPVWNLARFANINTVLETIVNPQMTDLVVMAKALAPVPPRSTVVKETRRTPDLQVITKTLKERFPGQSLPNTEVCEKIGDVFRKLATANKVNSEAAEGLADLSTLVTPEQYTMLLTAVVTPVIQIVVPGQLMSPISSPPLPPTQMTTTLAPSVIIKNTKLRVLPNPNSPALAACDKNSAMRVLAAATFLKLEKKFFDDTSTCMDIAGTLGVTCLSCQKH